MVFPKEGVVCLKEIKDKLLFTFKFVFNSVKFVFLFMINFGSSDQQLVMKTHVSLVWYDNWVLEVAGHFYE